MKKFFEDYWELSKASGRFCKKHWLGVTIMYIVVTGISFAALLPKKTKDLMIEEIKDKFN